MRSKKRSRDEVKASLLLFVKDVEELAKRHGLENVLVASDTRVDYDDGPGRTMVSWGFGDVFAHPPLAAYALGRAQDEVRKIVNQLALGGRK